MNLQETLGNPKKLFGMIGSVIGLLFVLSVVFGSYFTLGGGEYARVQNNISGTHTWYTSQGIHLKTRSFLMLNISAK